MRHIYGNEFVNSEGKIVPLHKLKAYTGVLIKFLARSTSPIYFFYGENISFDASLVVHIYK
jgi:hypothetical protein